MSAQVMRMIAYILFAVGGILLIVTVYFSFRFHIFRLLQIEFSKKSNVSGASVLVPSAGSAAGTGKSIASAASDSFFFEDVLSEESSVPDDEVSHTVVRSPSRSEATSGDTVLVGRAAQSATDQEFRIIENIMVFHGNPHFIH